MSKLTPEQIFRGYQNGDINEEELFTNVLKIIEESQDKDDKLAAIRFLITHNPKDTELRDRFLKSEYLNNLGLKELKGLLDEFEIVNETNFQFWLLLADDFIECALEEKGILIVKKLLELKPDNKDLWQILGLGYERFSMYGNVDRYTEAECAFKKAVNIDKTNLHSWKRLNSFYRERRQVAAQIEVLKSITERFPDYSDGWWELYTIYKERGDEKGAVEVLKSLKYLATHNIYLKHVKSWILDEKAYLESISKNNDKFDIVEFLKFNN